MATITFRLPRELFERLDAVAQKRCQSRSSVIMEALEHFLAPASNNEAPEDIMSFAGAGVGLSHRRTAEEIDAEIRWLRGDG